MNDRPRIKEIDISSQARALAWLRLTDYALVVLCGFWAIGIVSELSTGFIAGEVGMTTVELVAMAVLLGFAAYTGWRHVGVIDPSVWRAYDAVFPVLILFCALVAWSVLTTTGSLAAIMEQGRTETVLQLGGLFNAAWVAALALSGWIALVVLRRKKIAALDATVGQLLAPLAEQAGAAAVKAADVPAVNKGRGLVIGGAGLLLLLAYGLAPVPGNEKLAELYFRSAQYINLLGFFLLVRARRYFQVQADSLLAVDRRPPILFLRS
ncbi:MAG: hypothetical protein RLZ44_1414, partial [Pseudomonadota bacterium]